ncbi:Fc.00g108060.m01.CDS01 [Cosmosporella sp. VM-42]
MFRKFSSFGRKRRDEEGQPEELETASPSSSSASVADRVRGTGFSRSPLERLINDQKSRTHSEGKAAKPEPLSLTVVYTPEDAYKVDIIFIHGLRGTSRNTWTITKTRSYAGHRNF